MANNIAVELKNITKTFGSVVANKNVNFTLYNGEVVSILGENGSGKTTLMNMLAGIYFPDEGQIFVDGKEVVIRSPKDSHANKIGMIHQHFKLVDVFTAADNIILGEHMPKYSIVDEAKKLIKKAKEIKIKVNIDDEHAPVTSVKDIDTIKGRFFLATKIMALPFVKLWKKIQFGHLSKKRVAKLQKIANQYGFEIDLNKKIYDMSVSEKQTVEIIKVLYRGANVLILDEPTAVLTPQETEKLFNVIRKMRDDNKAIIIITHKLNEVMEISDRVAVLRKGEHIATVKTSETNENELTAMMVGKKVELNIDRKEPRDSHDRLIVKNLNFVDHEGVQKLKDISFTAKSGEILGIAGIAGSGQRELLESIAGLLHINSGDIEYVDPHKNEIIDLKSKNPNQIRDLGVRLSFVPEDRLGMGLVANMDIVDNMMLRSYGKGHSVFVNRSKPKHLANDIITELEVVTPSTHTQVRKLSGGNVQKVLVGREIASSPTVLMAAYPVRGLDINSSYTIYNLLNKQKEKGVAVIYVGEDLDVLIDLCDRILVLCGGEVSDIVDARSITKNEIGLLMTKTNKGMEVEENAK